MNTQAQVQIEVCVYIFICNKLINEQYEITNTI